MSQLQVTTITTVNNTTPLILQTGNTGGGQIILQASNNDVQFVGPLRFTANVVGDGSGLTIPSSNVANAAFAKANAALANASGTFAGNLSITGNVGIGATITDFSSTGKNAKFAVDSGGLNLDDGYFVAWGGGTGRTSITGNKNNGTLVLAAAANNSGHMTFTTNGAERMRIDANGRVGIGNTSPINKLSVQTAGADGIILEKDTGNPSNSGRMFFNADGTSFAICATANTLSFFSGSIPGISTGTTRLAIDSSGRVTLPTQPAFHAFLTSTTSFAAGTSARTLDNVVFNIGNHYNTSTGRFTAPVLGTYVFFCNVSLGASTQTQAYLSAEIWLNGVRQYAGGWDHRFSTTSTYLKVGSSYIIRLNAGDYVQFGCEIHQTENAQGGSGFTYMTGYLIG